MMTPEESQYERDYRIQERIGMACGDREPSEWQKEVAEREADQVVDRLKTIQASPETPRQ